MVLSKLERLLHTKQSHLCEKRTEYFKRRVADQTSQATGWTKTTATSHKAREENYAVAEIVGKKGNLIHLVR
jgi:hypothetical protein